MANFGGSEGVIHYERWDPEGTPARIVIIVHGYAEYAARYAHVAGALTGVGSVVYGQDHLGHGHSEGERALIVDFVHVIDDLRTLVDIALDETDDLGGHLVPVRLVDQLDRVTSS